MSKAILAKLTCVVDETNKKFGCNDTGRGHWKEMEFIRKSLVLNTETGIRSDSAWPMNQLKHAIRLMCKLNSNDDIRHIRYMYFIIICRVEKGAMLKKCFHVVTMELF